MNVILSKIISLLKPFSIFEMVWNVLPETFFASFDVTTMKNNESVLIKILKLGTDERNKDYSVVKFFYISWMLKAN